MTLEEILYNQMCGKKSFYTFKRHQLITDTKQSDDQTSISWIETYTPDDVKAIKGFKIRDDKLIALTLTYHMDENGTWYYQDKNRDRCYDYCDEIKFMIDTDYYEMIKDYE